MGNKKELVCDFCNTPNPTQAYDAGSEIRLRVFTEAGSQVGPGHMYSRFWAACDCCAEYLDRGDIDGLREAVIALATGHSEDKSFVAFYREALAALYDELKTRKITRVEP